MTASLTLAFAELEFVLALRPRRGTALRGNLRLENVDDETAPVLARAGMASLLARGLCEAVAADDGADQATLPDFRFGGELSLLLNALSDDDGTTTMAAAWRGDVGSVVHVVDGRAVRVALFPERFGQYKVEVLDVAEPVSALLERFLARHLAGGIPSALVAASAHGDRSAVIALSVDAAGQWSASDSVESPDHAVPVSRERALERLAVLFGSWPTAARSEAR